MAEHAEIIIAGAGFSGLAMAIKLQEAGRRDVLVLERAADVGGVWQLTRTRVRADAHARYNREIDSRMRGTVWDIGGCSSFYIDRTGRNATLWPDWTWRFRQRCREAPAEAYRLMSPIRELVEA